MKTDGNDCTGQGVSSGPARTPSAMSTETTPPFPSIATSELSNVTTNSTINHQPDLFKIVMPINVDKFKLLLLQHPNWLLVESVCHSLREGVWPYATNPNDLLTFDFSTHSLDNTAACFMREQWDLKIVAGRYSASFSTELLPGMYSPPISTFPKTAFYELETNQWPQCWPSRPQLLDWQSWWLHSTG